MEKEMEECEHCRRKEEIRRLRNELKRATDNAKK